MQRSRDFYHLLGLGVASELTLPLPRSPYPLEHDIEVVSGPVVADGQVLFRDDNPIPYACYQQGNAIVLAWTGVRFRVAPGQVVVDAEDQGMVAHLLVPAVWSVVLATKGRESLHGSAVSNEDQALAILGASGSGKTTASRALIEHGWELLSDDLLTFDERLSVVPGPPWIRVLTEDVGSAPGEPDQGGKVRIYPRVSARPVPLAAMIVMDPAFDECVRLSGMAAAAALFQQVYNPVLTHDGQVARRFDLVQSLADRIPIYGVPPRSLSAERLTGLLEEVRV
jgi:hypothetical protein